MTTFEIVFFFLGVTNALNCFQITSLEGIGNTTYGKILTLYADYNNITSLKALEGSMFLENFQNLSLTNNEIAEVRRSYCVCVKLTWTSMIVIVRIMFLRFLQIPRHVLMNVFDRSKGRTILLAKNYLRCECETAQVVKVRSSERIEFSLRTREK